MNPASPTVVAPPEPPALPSRASYTLREIQAHIGGELCGDPETLIVGFNGLEYAYLGELTFAENERYVAQARQSRASAIIVTRKFPAIAGRVLLRVENPRLAFLNVIALFQSQAKPRPGIHRQAVVAPDAELGEGVAIGECAVVRSRARIGRETVVESGVHIGEGASIGERCVIGPNVVIMRGCRIGNRVIIHGGTVIGADGFGYVWAEGRHLKIPQLGNVVIEDDVELGANVCVDRATFGSTIIKRGTKIDNLVQIAHNDVIGEHVTISGQAGLAGSVKVGDRVAFGGQVGVADHVTIGDDARLGAGSGVIKDVRPGETVWWFPARPIKRVKEELAALGLLPELLKQLRRSKEKRPRRSTR
jgi:UDP-3-O-[3-hydroxymyristoyl] glucosamine N-acyltransferase